MFKLNQDQSDQYLRYLNIFKYYVIDIMIIVDAFITACECGAYFNNCIYTFKDTS